MTKKEIIELYLADLNNLVPDSEAKRSRIIDLEDELEALRIHDVVCSCYMCGKIIEQPEKQFDMLGEIVCESCWDYNMYQALQDGGGM